MGFEESLIRNAAPTLAGIKVANLYNYHFADINECTESIERFNRELNHKGIYMELVKHDKDFYLLYVYRKKQLESILGDSDILRFLKKYGYDIPEDCDYSYYLNVMKYRVNHAAGFPHEIGIFLGYPLADVIEFIDRKGEGCALCGEWKAYYDVQNAKCFFCKVKKCKDVYLRVYNNGRSLYDMTVSI